MSAAGFYHCSVKSVGRSNGRSVVEAAAYRAGERLVDDRTGEIHDYRARGGVEDSFIITRADAPDWAMQAAREARQRLWNEAERAEPRPNGRLATELELGLPHELTPEQRKELVSAFVLKIVEKYGIAADVAIHAPGEEGDHRNHHAHVLFTHRELGPDGFGDIANTRTETRMRKGQEVQEQVAGIAATPADIRALRQEWEQHVNLHYERAGLDIRVDHRSHKDRGIPQEPTKHLGPEATAMERKGIATELGDANREIAARNEAIRERARLEIEAVKVQAELATAKMLAEMERQRAAEQSMQQQWAAAKGRVDDVRAPIFDRDAAERKADEKIVEAAIAAAQEARQQRKEARTIERDAPTAQGPYAPLQTEEPAPEKKAEPALGKTAGDIRMAFSLSRSASELQEGLASHGISLALTSAEEARQSQRTAAFAKEIGSFARLLREGEIVAVNGSGHVYRLDERITGQTRNELEGRLAGLDRAELSNIADTKEAMREAAQAAWIAEQIAAREKERLPNWIESRIAECGREARRDVTIGYRDSEDRLVGRAEALAERFKPEDEQTIRAATVHGREAFDTRLDDADIAISRVKEVDLKGLAALREQQRFDRESGLAHKPHHIAADLVAGDLCAVTRNGDVYKINPDKLGDAKQYLAADLPGVVEARATFEIQREQKAEIYAERRADNLAARQDFAAERESQAQHAETVRNVRQFNQDIGEAVDTGFKATGGFMRGLARMAEKFLESLSDFLAPPPPPTKDQAERMARSAEEKAQAHAEQTAQAERDTGQYWLIEEARRRVQEKEAGLSPESERKRDDSRDRGYERERF